MIVCNNCAKAHFTGGQEGYAADLGKSCEATFNTIYCRDKGYVMRDSSCEQFVQGAPRSPKKPPVAKKQRIEYDLENLGLKGLKPNERLV